MFHERILLLALFALVMAGLGAAAVFAPASLAAAGTTSPTPAAATDTVLAGEVLVGCVTFFFVLASAVRTERPAFRLTAGNILRCVAFAWIYLVMIAGGIALFVVPGLYSAVRLAPMSFYALLADGNAFLDAQRLTAGHFWTTAALAISLWLGGELALMVANGVPAVIAVAVPPAGIVLWPLAYLLSTYVLTVIALTWSDYCFGLVQAPPA